MPDPLPAAATPSTTLVARPGPRPRTVLLPSGQVAEVPAGWELLPPGDAGLTRKVKAAGPTWTVKQRRGRREFSQGLWADRRQIAAAKQAMDAKRQSPGYEKQLAAARRRRDEKQQAYVQEFTGAVLDFLDFHERYAGIARRMAVAVAEHATPVGSGTVARTSRIPIGQRAESAVIAWMRHQTTAYDQMSIARAKGRRREVRRQLAAESRKVLRNYRQGTPDALRGCPLARALRGGPPPSASF